MTNGIAGSAEGITGSSTVLLFDSVPLNSPPLISHSGENDGAATKSGSVNALLFYKTYRCSASAGDQKPVKNQLSLMFL